VTAIILDLRNPEAQRPFAKLQAYRNPYAKGRCIWSKPINEKQPTECQ
jgi:hypothetical protein